MSRTRPPGDHDPHPPNDPKVHATSPDTAAASLDDHVRQLFQIADAGAMSAGLDPARLAFDGAYVADLWHGRMPSPEPVPEVRKAMTGYKFARAVHRKSGQRDVQPTRVGRTSRPREHRPAAGRRAASSSTTSSSDPGDSSSDEPEPPSAGRRCAAPWCDHPVHGSSRKRYCGTERCELSRASDRQRKHRAAGLNSDELNQLEEARITHYIGARAFASPGKHALSYLWRFGLASGEDPGECQAIATLNRACRCNGHHIAGGAVGCFKCGLPRPVRA